MMEHEVSLFQTDDAVWITVGDKITVRVLQTDEGAVCDMYDTSKLEDDMFEAHTSGCYTFFSEVGEDTTDHDSTDEDIDYFNDD